MKTRAAILLFLIFALFLTTRFALDLKEKGPNSNPSNLRELKIAGSAGDFLKGKIRPIAMGISSGGFSLDLGLQQNGWWWIFRPEKTMANQPWAHQWATALTQPKLLRKLQPSEWKPINVEETYQIKLYGSGNITADFQLFKLKSSPQYVYFQLEDGSAIKAEWDAPPTWPKNMAEVRTKRLWPFDMTAIKTLTYQRGGKTRTWSLLDGKWKTNRHANPRFWEPFFKRWGQWSSRAFLENHQTKDQAQASWEIEFQSGDRAKVELFPHPIYKWIAQYRGRPIAQVLTEESLLACFPTEDF